MGKRVLDRSFSTGTSDFGKVERTTATISRVGGPVIPAADLSTFNTQLRGTRLHNREELEFAVRSAVAILGVDFYKDVCSEWVERHIQCAACGGSYFEKGMQDMSQTKTLINRRRQHDVPKCSVRPCDPNFIYIF